LAPSTADTSALDPAEREGRVNCNTRPLN